VRWTKDESENAAVSQFGFTLEEVQEYQSTLDQENANIAKEAESRLNEIQGVWNSMNQMGVTENIYTTSTPDTLAKVIYSIISIFIIL
jgi:hypothetical protein